MFAEKDLDLDEIELGLKTPGQVGLNWFSESRPLALSLNRRDNTRDPPIEQGLLHTGVAMQTTECESPVVIRMTVMNQGLLTWRDPHERHDVETMAGTGTGSHDDRLRGVGADGVFVEGPHRLKI